MRITITSTGQARPRRLHLLRHAKSSWDEPWSNDAERPLAPRGRRAAARIGRHLREAALAPDLVLCSPARRARETLERLGLPVPARIEPALYGASAGALLALARALPPEHHEVLLIGHNPSLEELGPLRTALAAKYPTGALATFALPGSWAALDAGGARLEAFIRPRDLPGKPA